MKTTLIARIAITAAIAAVLAAAGLTLTSAQSTTSPSSQVVAGDHFIITVSAGK